jgi:hypothetical protein
VNQYAFGIYFRCYRAVLKQLADMNECRLVLLSDADTRTFALWATHNHRPVADTENLGSDRARPKVDEACGAHVATSLGDGNASQCPLLVW